VDDNVIPELKIFGERVERIFLGLILTTTALALQRDHILNEEKEDRFLVSGLKQAERPAIGFAAQKSAGSLIMTTLLELVFPGANCPKIRDVRVISGPRPSNPASLPTIIFAFENSLIARDVRFRLLQHGKTSPALDQIYIEPLMTPATRVRVQMLFAIPSCLVAKDVVCYVRKFDRFPHLVVTHDHRNKSYDFVRACVEFRSLLTPKSLRLAYMVAGRDFVDRLTPLFIVLTDGGQPLPTFTAPTVPTNSLVQSSTLPSNIPSTLVSGLDPVARPNFPPASEASRGIYQKWA
jgi:hypothetical protein